MFSSYLTFSPSSSVSCVCDYGLAFVLGMFIMLVVFALIEFCRAIFGKE